MLMLWQDFHCTEISILKSRSVTGESERERNITILIKCATDRKRRKDDNKFNENQIKWQQIKIMPNFRSNRIRIRQGAVMCIFLHLNHSSVEIIVYMYVGECVMCVLRFIFLISSVFCSFAVRNDLRQMLLTKDQISILMRARESIVPLNLDVCQSDTHTFQSYIYIFRSLSLSVLFEWLPSNWSKYIEIHYFFLLLGKHIQYNVQHMRIYCLKGKRAVDKIKKTGSQRRNGTSIDWQCDIISKGFIYYQYYEHARAIIPLIFEFRWEIWIVWWYFRAVRCRTRMQICFLFFIPFKTAPK